MNTKILYCECESPLIDVEHDAGCRRCGRPVNFGPRCNCESSYCKHDPASCSNSPEGNWSMDYVGAICDECAASIVASGGGRYIHPPVSARPADEDRAGGRNTLTRFADRDAAS